MSLIAIYANKKDYANDRVIVAQDTLMKTYFLITEFYYSGNV